MNGRGARLARLQAIRGLSEGIKRTELARALALVAEVETVLVQQKAMQADAKIATRAALDAGERGEWLLAEAQGEVAGWNCERLRGLLRVRTEAVAPAMRGFIESRREHEQVKQLVEDERRAQEIERDRRAQATADDWFLSRRGRGME